jgi:hypothetical protein
VRTGCTATAACCPPTSATAARCPHAFTTAPGTTCTSRQELSTLSATLSSSLPGGNLRQWLKPDLPGGWYPRLRVFGPSSQGADPSVSLMPSLQPPDLGQDWAPANLPTVFLRSLSVYDMRDYGLFAPTWRSSCRSPGTPSRCLPWGGKIPGNYGRLSTPACATLASHEICATQLRGPHFLPGSSWWHAGQIQLRTHWAVVG